MHTVTLQTIKRPSCVGVLLRELSHETDVIPKGAYEIAERNNLPPTLRRVAQCAEHLNASWACWVNDAGQVWFFVAEMPLQLSRDQGKPVLQLDRYGDDGLIIETGRWVKGSGEKWQRLSID